MLILFNNHSQLIKLKLTGIMVKGRVPFELVGDWRLHNFLHERD